VFFDGHRAHQALASTQAIARQFGIDML